MKKMSDEKYKNKTESQDTANMSNSMEESLRQSDEKYKTILETIQEGYFETDFAGNFTFFNDSVCKILGYSKDELMGMNYRRYTDKEDLKRIFQAYNKVYKTGELNNELIWQIIRKDGTKRYIEGSVSLQKDPSGQSTGFRGIVRDVTERKIMEEAWKKREALLNAMGAMAKVGGWEFDVKSQKQIWTKEVYQMHEVDESYEPTVRKEIDFYEIESRHVIERAVQRAIEDGAPFDLELGIITAKSNHRWVHAIGSGRREDGITKTVSGTFQDITERKQKDEMIRHMAYHDSLTNLPNRKLFSDRLGIALANAQRNKKSVAIGMIDLDNFKIVNDTLGHDVGDILLKTVAQRLIEMLRKSDTVARFGGDEFVLIIHDLKGIEDAIQVAQKIVESFCKPFLINIHQLVVTSSIGIALYPRDGEAESILLINADKAMYQAKQAGRNQYSFYNKV